MEATLPSCTSRLVTLCVCACLLSAMSLQLTGSPPSVASWLLKTRRKQRLQNPFDSYELKFGWISGANLAIRYDALSVTKFGLFGCQKLWKTSIKEKKKKNTDQNGTCSAICLARSAFSRINCHYLVKTWDSGAEHLPVYLYILFVVTVKSCTTFQVSQLSCLCDADFAYCFQSIKHVQRIFHHPWCLTSISWYNYRKASEDCGWAPDSKKKKKKILYCMWGGKTVLWSSSPKSWNVTLLNCWIQSAVCVRLCWSWCTDISKWKLYVSNMLVSLKLMDASELLTC